MISKDICLPICLRDTSYIIPTLHVLHPAHRQVSSCPVSPMPSHFCEYRSFQGTFSSPTGQTMFLAMLSSWNVRI